MGGIKFYAAIGNGKVNTSAHRVAHTRSSTDRGGSAFLVDMFYDLVKARLVPCEQKFQAALKGNTRLSVYFYGFDDDSRCAQVTN